MFVDVDIGFWVIDEKWNTFKSDITHKHCLDMVESMLDFELVFLLTMENIMRFVIYFEW